MKKYDVYNCYGKWYVVTEIIDSGDAVTSYNYHSYTLKRVSDNRFIRFFQALLVKTFY